MSRSSRQEIRVAHTVSYNRIKQGKPVRRICVVLVPGETSVEVTYVATFDQSHTLPHTLDKEMWYPFKPATKEGDLEPLPELSNKKAQWASLRTKHTVTQNPVSSLGVTCLEPDQPGTDENINLTQLQGR